MMTSISVASAHYHRDIPFNRSINSDHDHDWGRVFRLVSISLVATLASVGNIFTISSLVIDDILRKKGNAFLVSITLADLLVTAFVLPASSVAILASMENSEKLCQFQYGVGSMSCLAGAMFTAAIGIENFLRIRNIRHLEYTRPPPGAPNVNNPTGASQLHSNPVVPNPSGKSSVCSVFQVTTLNLLVWLVAGLVLLVHFYSMPQLMKVICGGSEAQKLISQRALVESIMLLGMCFLVFVSLGGLGLLKCLCMIRTWNKPKPYLTSREFALFKSNFWNWLVRFLIWFPSLSFAIITESQRATNQILNGSTTSSASLHSANFRGVLNPFTLPPFHTYTSNQVTSTSGGVGPLPIDSSQTTLQRMLVWPVILPSCLGCLVHALANKDFRRCYTQLFHYCCCKTSVAITRRPTSNLRAPKDVRVHMLLSHSNAHSEVANVPTSRFVTKFRCASLSQNSKRDVYEL